MVRPNGFVSNEDITDLWYILTVTDSTNCIAVDAITLIENPELIIETDSLLIVLHVLETLLDI